MGSDQGEIGVWGLFVYWQNRNPTEIFSDVPRTDRPDHLLLFFINVDGCH